MWIEKNKAFLTRVRESLPGRWFWLLVGLGLIINGVYWVHQRGDINEASQILLHWNEEFHLEIVNILYLVVAIPYLVGGGLLSAFAFVPLWKKQEEIQTPTKTREPLNRAYFLPRVAFTILLFTLLIVMLAQHKYTPILLVMGLHPDRTNLLAPQTRKNSRNRHPSKYRAHRYNLDGRAVPGGIGDWRLCAQ